MYQYKNFTIYDEEMNPAEVKGRYINNPWGIPIYAEKRPVEGNRRFEYLIREETSGLVIAQGSRLKDAKRAFGLYMRQGKGSETLEDTVSMLISERRQKLKELKEKKKKKNRRKTR